MEGMSNISDLCFQIAGKNKMEEYPILTRFCYTAEELHEEYGLSLEGVLPKDLTEEDLPNDQWLTVFKQSYQKNAKIYVNQVQPKHFDECRFLFHKVYQAPPSCGEITAKFARCFAFENCHAATKDPAMHKVAWARFGESVLSMCASRPGGLDRKVETWRRANGASHGGLGPSQKKPRNTHSGSNLCTEVDLPQRPVQACEYVTDLESIVERLPQKCAAALDKLKELRESVQKKKETLLRAEGLNVVAKRIKDDIDGYEVQLVKLKEENPCNADEIKEVEADLAASQRMLRQLGNNQDMLELEKEIHLQQVRVIIHAFRKWFGSSCSFQQYLKMLFGSFW